MTQSIVPFIIDNSAIIPGASTSNPVMAGYVFSSEISKEAQEYYQNLMTVLNASLAALQAKRANGQTITASDTDAQNFVSALNALNSWASMVSVNSANGTQNAPTTNTTLGGGSTVAAFNPSSSITTYSVASFGITGVPNPAYDPSQAISSTNPQFISGAAQGVTTTMSSYMAQALEQINRTIKAASGGTFSPDMFISPTASGLGTTQGTGLLTALTALASPDTSSVYQITSLITKAINAAQQALIIGNAGTQSQSIQQAIAVDYIATGNQLIFNNMNSLNQAINQNQVILQFLNALQDLMNQKSPQQFALQFSAISNTSTGATDAQYDTFEQQSFNQQLGTIAAFTGNSASTVADANTLLQQAFANVSSLSDPDYIASLSNTSSANFQALSFVKNTLVNNISQLVMNLQATGTTSGSGLITALNQIKTDLTAATNIASWVQDFAVNNSSNGSYQQNLNNAVTAAQSFNQTQQANLQQAMFIYQQFFQSASGIMSQINQIISSAASNISK